jgi:RNA polymerase sigma-70 factor (ECF subfamily)
METLLDRLRRREAAAFQEAIARYGAPMQRTVAQLLRDPVEAEDVVQEAFARLFLNLDTVRSLKPWLFQVAVNLARELLRRRRAPPARPAAAVADRELREVIERALEELPEKTRVAFVLRELGGLTTDEVASAERCSPEAVRQRIMEARRRLRDVLGPRMRQEVS